MLRYIQIFKNTFAVVLVCFIGFSTYSYSQATNSNCETAISWGNLGAPGACPAGIGTTLTGNFTNLGAVATNPYQYIPTCTPSNLIGSPPGDVWFVFQMGSPYLGVDITGDIDIPYVTVWTGTCGNLTAITCAVGAGGTLSTVLGNMTSGQFYYMQISGDDASDLGDFTIEVTPMQDCEDCVREHNLTANPPPVNGTYQPGTEVEFCYSITRYNQTNTNWHHGVVPNFGAGWDMATLDTDNWYPAQDGRENYGWFWFDDVDGLSGFFFDNRPCCVAGMGGMCTTYCDYPAGDPTNNYGDNVTGNVNWEWCWTISTPVVCVEGADLSVNIVSYGDGETGSWSSLACTSDPEWDFSAVSTCCPFPTVSSTPPSCIGVNDGTATVTGDGASPFDYDWVGPNGFTANEVGIAGVSTQVGLEPGVYTVTVEDDNGCIRVVDVVVIAAVAPCGCTLEVEAGANSAVCRGGSVDLDGSYLTPDGAVTIAWTSLPVGAVGDLNNTNTLNPTFTPTVNYGSVTFTLSVTDDNCTRTDDVIITVNPLPVIDPIANVVICDSLVLPAIDGTNLSGSEAYYTAPDGGGTRYGINSTIYFDPLETYPLTLYAFDETNFAIGCYDEETFDLTINASPTVPTADLTQPTCDVPTGTIEITAPLGVDIEYSIDGGTTWVSGAVFSGLTADDYTIQVRDNSVDPTCVSSEDFTINAIPSIPTVPSADLTQPTCGLPTGAIEVIAPLSADIEYSIDGGTTWVSTTTFSLLVADDTYTIQVRDNSVDATCIASEDFVINAIPSIPTVPTADLTQPTCAVPTGTIEITAPLSADIEYSIDGGTTWVSTTTFSGLVADDTYTIQVRDNSVDATCVSSDVFVINTVPNTPSVPTATVTDASCAIPTGTIEVTAPLSADIEYSIDGGTTWVSTTTFSGLVSNTTYTIQVRDNSVDATCISSEDFTVAASADLPVNPTADLTQPTCAIPTGTIEVTAPLGADIEYSIDGGATWVFTTTFSGLVADDTYTIQVRDSGGDLSCVSSSNFIINTIPNAPVLVITDPSPVCSPATVDITDAAVTLGSTDANNITYWEDAGATISYTTPTTATDGTYFIQAENSGCVVIEQVDVTVNPLPVFSILGSTDPTSCGGTDGTITLTGLSANINYDLSYTYGPISDLNGPNTITTTAGGVYVIISLEADIYNNFTINDGNCEFVLDDAQALTDPNPPGFDPLFNQHPTTCANNDGIIDIIGTPLLPNTAYDLTYTYIDDNGDLEGILVSIITDDFGNYMLEGLSSGDYSAFSVIDPSTLCTWTVLGNTVTLLFDVFAPDAPNVIVSNPTCSNDGDALIGDYDGAFTYSFSDIALTEDASGVISGFDFEVAYTVTAYDPITLCTSVPSAPFTVSEMLITPDVPTVTVVAPTCSSNGTASIDNYAGGLTYTFAPVGPMVDGSGNISNVNFGTAYTITAGNGSCTSVVSAPFTVAAMLPTPAVPNISVVAPTCSANGSASISNYAGGLTYTFAPVGPTVDGSGNISNVTLGTAYTVTAGDENCTSVASAPFTVFEINPIPDAPTAGNDATYCHYELKDALFAVASLGGNLTWYSDAALTQEVGSGTNITPGNTAGVFAYYVIETAEGCEGPATLVTIVIEQCDIEIPTAFTPDNDDVNDVWEIPNLNENFPDCVVRIFNRWGNLLFESTGYDKPWDGTYNGEPLPVASYYYIIEFNNADNERATGPLTIIRR